MNETPNTAAIILAAGRSRRMGATNKLLVRIDGKQMIRHVAEAAIESRVGRVFVVTGYEAGAIKTATGGLDMTFVDNPDHASGLSTSLAAGIKALGNNVERVIILLGDMPFVRAGMIRLMFETAQKSTDDSIIVATGNGKRGNPVLWPRMYFTQLCEVEGDTGAKNIILAHASKVVEVNLGEAARHDIDTPHELAGAGGDISTKT